MKKSAVAGERVEIKGSAGGIKLFFLSFVSGIFLPLWVFSFSCAKKMPLYPETFEAEIVSSLDPENVQVMAKGTWEHEEGALKEAKMNAMWIVIQTLAQTDEEKAKVESRKQDIFSQVDRFVMMRKIVSRQNTPEDKIKIGIDAVVRKKMLEDYLVSIGAIKKREELIEKLDNPSIVVIPSDIVRKEGWTEFVANEINAYLTTKKFEVLNPETLDKLYEMAQQIEKIEGLPDDPTAKIALSVGADIYITFEGKVEQGAVGSDKTIKAAASVKAFETTTARMIGSSTGFSKELVAGPGKDRVVLAEAVRDAIDKVLTQVMDYWKSDIKDGKQYLIFVYGDFSNLEKQKPVVDAVKSISSKYKRETATQKFMSFRLWFSGTADDLLFSLQDELKKRGLNINPKVQNRKMIQAEIM